MSIVNITFDSNVWPIVVSPNRDKFGNEQALPSFQTINLSIRNGYAKGFLAETVFTLEAVKRVDRRKFIQDYNPPFIVEEYIQGNNIGLGINIAPDKTSHPGNNTYFISDLHDALLLGFRVLPCKRFGWIKNPDLRDEWFTKLTDAEISSYEDAFGEVVNKIKNYLCGSYEINRLLRAMPTAVNYALFITHWSRRVC
ncbi:hypothetical protein [Nostoc sp.]|uniref:hypothetical protein n=1 Tax=Nostoc sp. TaxID=1180 RepID=UPI002FFA570F